MKLIGYRFKNNDDGEAWAYTYDVEGAIKGGALKEYDEVEKVYSMDKYNSYEYDGKHLVQVVIPKVSKAVDMMLSFCQTRNYDEFKNSVYQLIEAPEYKKQLKPWLDNGGYKKLI